MILERKGVQFRLSLEKEPQRAAPKRSPLRVLDPVLVDGEWSWQADASGELSFKPRKETP